MHNNILNLFFYCFVGFCLFQFRSSDYVADSGFVCGVMFIIVHSLTEVPSNILCIARQLDIHTHRLGLFFFFF